MPILNNFMAIVRGIGKVFEQSLLCAAVQNMKKIALVVDRKELLLFLRLLKQVFAPIQRGCYFFNAFLAKVRQIVIVSTNPLIIENPA